MGPHTRTAELGAAANLHLAAGAVVNTMALRWGVAGCGWVAQDYMIPALQRAQNAQLCALYDLDPSAMNGNVTTQLDEFLGNPKLDAIYVATPNHSHAALVKAAAKAGKHVLCEKPMATSFADAASMIADCEQANVLYATAFDQRFHAAHIRLREAIAAGYLGLVTAARIHYACWLPPAWAADNWRIDPARAGGGAWIDLAPHGLDLLSYLIGEPWAEGVCRKQRKAFDYPVDDGAVWIGSFAGGALGSIHVAYNCPDGFPRRTLEVYGTKAMAIARNTMGQTPGGTLELIDADGTRQTLHVAEELDRSPFLNQIECFSRCVLEGSPFPFSPQRDLATHKILLEERCL